MTASSAVSVRHSYHVYGIHVTSAVPLQLPEPAFEGCEDALLAHVDVVEASDDDFRPFRAAGAWSGDFVSEEIPGRGTYLRWPQFYEVSVRADGHRVACRALNGCDSSVLQNFLLGQILAVALVYQGIEPLHASVVAIDGAAVGLVGDCAYGKSTLLASLLQAGFRAVTDDMLIVERSEGGLHAVAGAGRIKLTPDSADRFFKGAGGMLLTPLTSKRAFVLDESKLQRVRVPLQVLYVLPTPAERQQSRSIEIREMSQVETVTELVRNTFSPHVLDRRRLVRQFEYAADLASRANAFRLRYPAGLDYVPDVRQAIVEHARRLIGTATRRAHE